MKRNLSAVLICIAVVMMPGFTNITASSLKNRNMKQFSLVVRVPDGYTSEQAKATNPLWDKALDRWKSEGSYVLSFAFPGESYTVSNADKTIKKESILSGHLRVVSNIVLQAETIEQALEFSKYCPILEHGGSVEVREIPRQVQFAK